MSMNEMIAFTHLPNCQVHSQIRNLIIEQNGHGCLVCEYCLKDKNVERQPIIFNQKSIDFCIKWIQKMMTIYWDILNQLSDKKCMSKVIKIPKQNIPQILESSELKNKLQQIILQQINVYEQNLFFLRNTRKLQDLIQPSLLDDLKNYVYKNVHELLPSAMHRFMNIIQACTFDEQFLQQLALYKEQLIKDKGILVDKNNVKPADKKKQVLNLTIIPHNNINNANYQEESQSPIKQLQSIIRLGPHNNKKVKNEQEQKKILDRFIPLQKHVLSSQQIYEQNSSIGNNRIELQSISESIKLHEIPIKKQIITTTDQKKTNIKRSFILPQRTPVRKQKNQFMYDTNLTVKNKSYEERKVEDSWLSNHRRKNKNYHKWEAKMYQNFSPQSDLSSNHTQLNNNYFSCKKQPNNIRSKHEKPLSSQFLQHNKNLKQWKEEMNDQLTNLSTSIQQISPQHSVTNPSLIQKIRQKTNNFLITQQKNKKQHILIQEIFDQGKKQYNSQAMGENLINLKLMFQTKIENLQKNKEEIQKQKSVLMNELTTANQKILHYEEMEQSIKDYTSKLKIYLLEKEALIENLANNSSARNLKDKNKAISEQEETYKQLQKYQDNQRVVQTLKQTIENQKKIIINLTQKYEKAIEQINNFEQTLSQTINNQQKKHKNTIEEQNKNIQFMSNKLQKLEHQKNQQICHLHNQLNDYIFDNQQKQVQFIHTRKQLENKCQHMLQLELQNRKLRTTISEQEQQIVELIEQLKQRSKQKQYIKQLKQEIKKQKVILNNACQTVPSQETSIKQELNENVRNNQKIEKQLKEIKYQRLLLEQQLIKQPNIYEEEVNHLKNQLSVLQGRRKINENKMLKDISDMEQENRRLKENVQQLQKEKQENRVKIMNAQRNCKQVCQQCSQKSTTLSNLQTKAAELTGQNQKLRTNIFSFQNNQNKMKKQMLELRKQAQLNEGLLEQVVDLDLLRKKREDDLLKIGKVVYEIIDQLDQPRKEMYIRMITQQMNIYQLQK